MHILLILCKLSGFFFDNYLFQFPPKFCELYGCHLQAKLSLGGGCVISRTVGWILCTGRAGFNLPSRKNAVSSKKAFLIIAFLLIGQVGNLPSQYFLPKTGFPTVQLEILFLETVITVTVTTVMDFCAHFTRKKGANHHGLLPSQ